MAIFHILMLAMSDFIWVALYLVIVVCIFVTIILLYHTHLNLNTTHVHKSTCNFEDSDIQTFWIPCLTHKEAGLSSFYQCFPLLHINCFLISVFYSCGIYFAVSK